MIANALSQGLARPMNWIHMPVPRDRDDDAYFAPLDGLDLGAETDLFLGLVHYTDGEDGTRRRMAAADRRISGYGIAPEYGLGRRDPATIPDLLGVHMRCATYGPAPGVSLSSHAGPIARVAAGRVRPGCPHPVD